MITGFLRMEMPTAWYLILPAAVWSIYTWDHLLDAQRLGPDASTPRHRFHHRHFRILGLSTILGALLSTAAAVLFLGPKGLVFGLCMGGFAALHFLLVQFVGGRTSPLLVKELGVALVYCLGIWGLPAIESGRIADPVLWIGFGQFFLLALTNLFEFSLFELRIDEADGHTSYVRALGETRTVQLIGSVLTASLLLGAIGILRYGLPAFLRLEATYLPMALILGAILWRRELFAGEERYRAWGDGAFLLPFLYRLIP